MRKKSCEMPTEFECSGVIVSGDYRLAHPAVLPLHDVADVRFELLGREVVDFVAREAPLRPVVEPQGEVEVGGQPHDDGGRVAVAVVGVRRNDGVFHLWRRTVVVLCLNNNNNNRRNGSF